MERVPKRRLFWRDVAIISGIVMTVAPLFGLLGTVFGMIGAFDTMGLGGGGDPEKLAGNISLALFTTAGGLVVSGFAFVVLIVSLILMIRARPADPPVAEN